MTLYEHRQYGLFTVVASIAAATVAVALIVITATGAGSQGQAVIGVVVVAVALVLVLFHSLLVRVTDRRIELRFGPGAIRRSFPLDRVDTVAPVRNRWYYGWGIRLTPHGWLFNVAGLDAVEIRMDDGRRFRIGTDRPIELATAIERARVEAQRRDGAASAPRRRR